MTKVCFLPLSKFGCILFAEEDGFLWGMGGMHHHQPWSWYFIVVRCGVVNQTVFSKQHTKLLWGHFYLCVQYIIEYCRVMLLSVILQLNYLLRICFQDFLLPLLFRHLEEIVVSFLVLTKLLSFLVLIP